MVALLALVATARALCTTALFLSLRMDSVPCQFLPESAVASSRLAHLLICLSTWVLSEELMALHLVLTAALDIILVG